MERKTEIESKTEVALEIDAAELIKNLNENMYAKTPGILQNLKIKFTGADADTEFEKILALLQDKKLSHNITRLDVSCQQGAGAQPLTKLPPNIGTLSALTVLNVHANKLTTLADIGRLTGLTTLDVPGNQLTTLANIEQLTALTALDVRTNKLTTLPVGLGNCIALKFLHVKANPLQEGTPKTIEELQAKWRALQSAYCIGYTELNAAIKESTPIPEVLTAIITDYAYEFAAKNSLSETTMNLLVHSVGNPQDWLKANGSSATFATKPAASPDASTEEPPKRPRP